MIFFILLLFLVLVAQIAELFIPALPWLYNAHVYIVPVIVFYGAMALPFPLMLALALYAGVLLDALTVQVIGGKVEISAGSSILLYGVLAGIMHGLRPLFARGHWEVHCILSGLVDTSSPWHRMDFAASWQFPSDCPHPLRARRDQRPQRRDSCPKPRQL